ncbi:hypothetical protein [Vibrio paracholerae]|uniref:Uncharacterized protein n=1 Tax=Vibrio paracholerae TaxID=650003 RepID=A0ABD7FRQ7_9VIBR|nr:hypothetical protein [Vibrio paracholerae]EKF9179503.1 hypothetical protein [Vibrio cholerae]RBM58276.1 hypothetical protein DLR72_18815 [Vibrio paracholerae]HDI3164435.1 hypothetical protein [Vibrio cholerae]
MVENISVIVSVFSFFAAVASAIAAIRSYKLAKNLARICNLFPSVNDNRFVITCTSTTERLIAHEILIVIHENRFKRKTYSLTRLYNLNAHFQKASLYDAIFPTLFERGLVSGESYEFPIAELFKIATNRIHLQKETVGLDPEKLWVGQRVAIIFMLNGCPYKVAIRLTQQLIDEILSGKTTFSDFRLRVRAS